MRPYYTSCTSKNGTPFMRLVTERREKMTKVNETVLYVTKPNHTIPMITAHPKTKHKTRLTDGINHPIKVRKATPEELNK